MYQYTKCNYDVHNNVPADVYYLGTVTVFLFDDPAFFENISKIIVLLQLIHRSLDIAQMYSVRNVQAYFRHIIYNIYRI